MTPNPCQLLPSASQRLQISWSWKYRDEAFSRKSSVHQDLSDEKKTRLDDCVCVCQGSVCGSGATSHSHFSKHKFISDFLNVKGSAATDRWRIQTESVIFAGTFLKLKRCKYVLCVCCWSWNTSRWKIFNKPVKAHYFNLFSGYFIKQ